MRDSMKLYSRRNKRFQIDLTWDVFSYGGSVVALPFAIQIQGQDFATVDSIYFDTESTSSQNTAGYSQTGANPAEYKKITFCDGTAFLMNGRNAFLPSSEMQKYLSENNCGLCGDFDSNGISELESFMAIDGSTYTVDDMFSFSKYAPLAIQ